MVNYVLSFCKITGASKIFKRNFYLPLLKPLTPKDALRTLRITGKWLLGAKYQHYIPALRNHKQKRSKKSKNYGTKEHKRIDDFTYMTPAFDPENENQKRLQKLLDSKGGGGGMYVYTIEDKKYNIVVQAAFELALRDGDIVDVMLSQKNDKLLVKTKDFKKVPLDMQYYEDNGEKLYCGEGATSAEEEKFHHHGKYTMSLAKLFEDKEMQEEKWEEELKKIMKKRKKHKWEGTKAFKEMMKQIMRKFDWKKFEEDAKQVIDDIEAPVSENPIPMEIADLDATKRVNETLSQHPALLNQLPTLKDVPDIIKSLGAATLTEIEITDSNDEKRNLSGVKVTLPSGRECFVSGQMVHTEEGDVFVPGQTVENEFGAEYAPGITINIDNKPTLVNGLIMGDEEKDPLFLPTQSTITSSGQLTFATDAEERPAPEPEEQRLKRRRKLLRIISVVPEEESNEESGLKEAIEDIMKQSGLNDFDNVEIIVENEKNLIDEEDSDISTDETSTSDELNSSELEELDIEAIKLKHEQQRQELERLKLILQDDGMNDLLLSLEEKKQQLKQKLEELRKLSMISENNLVTYVNDSDACEAASKITAEKESINRLAEILIGITRRSAAFRDKNSIRVENINLDVNIKPTETDLKFNKSSDKLKILFKTALVAANDVYKNRPKDQVLALHSVVDIIEDSLKKNPQLLQELLKLLDTSYDRLEVCDAVLKQLTQDISHTKVASLKHLSNENLTLQDCLKYLDRIVEDGTVMNVSFTKLAKLCPEIIKDLIDNIKLRMKSVNSEEKALQALQDSVVATVRALMDSNFEELLGKKESTVLEFMEEAMSFAKALELDEVVENLSKPKTALNNLGDASIEMLKRMTIIRQLAEKDYSLKTAISRIKKNPECAKSDPRIRQLIRESAIVMSEMSSLRNSRDIPYDLMKKQNLLSIEDFLMRKMRLDVPVLVTRGNLQAVIPKESARGVLAGRVPYILIDESGVTNFKPMHMLSSINVNKNRERRIEDYLSGVRERSKSIDLDKGDSKTYLEAKSNSTDGQYMGTARGRAMSSGALLGHRF